MIFGACKEFYFNFLYLHDTLSECIQKDEIILGNKFWESKGV